MNEMIFCFNQQEAQLLLDALVELPFKRSADLIFKILNSRENIAC